MEVADNIHSESHIHRPKRVHNLTSMRITNALSAISHERFVQMADTGARYSPSTLKKHDWVIKMYEAFSERASIDAWPLHGVNVAWFIRFLGLEAKYAVSSIEDVIMPSLKRLHIEHCNEAPSTEVVQYMSQALKDVKHSKAQLKGSEGKEPAIYPDVKRIIEATPHGVITKAEEACLWLLSLSTGARAVTCFNVNIGDIQNVIKKPNSNCILIQVLFRVTKGNPAWNHMVTLEGHPSYNSSTNIAYWLQRHLKQAYSIDLLERAEWPLKVLSNKLFQWSKDSMRELFKTRAALAGFPHSLFSFHSLRSGFLCTSLLKAGTDSNAIKAVLENIAYVAGWIPNQAAQLRYVKESAKRTIVTSRLVIPNEEQESNNVVDALLATSETFHHVTLSPSSWDPQTNYKSFYAAVNERFTRKDLTSVEETSLRSKCWRNAYNIYVLRDESLENQSRAIYSLKSEWKIPKSRYTVEMNTRYIVGRNHIASLLNSNFELLDELVESFVALVQDDIELVNPLRIYNRPIKQAYVPLSTRECIQSSGHRKRIKWTEDEDRILASGHRTGKSWVEIARNDLIERSNVDCKDRWRNLIKKFGSEEDIYRIL